MGEVDEEPALASTDPSLPIQKKVLHAGRGELPEYKDGTKVPVLLRAVLWIRIRTIRINLGGWNQGVNFPKPAFSYHHYLFLSDWLGVA